MAGSSSRRPRVLLTTVPSDAHTWNLVYLQLLMDEAGYDVTNLGNCPTVDLVHEAATAHTVDAIVISSINGHGALDGAALISHLRQDPRLRDVPVAIGGKLGIAGASHAEDDRLLRAGATRVFTDDEPADELVAWLSAATAAGDVEKVVA